MTVYRGEMEMRSLQLFLYLALHYLDLKGGETKEIKTRHDGLGKFQQGYI
ncbi:MAG: hypothetical protein ACE5D4_06680 [Thermodesulfobacteriota bacterium]